MTIKRLLAAAALTLAATLPSQAALLLGTSTSGASVATDYGADGLISFDLDLHDLHAIRLDFALSAADVAGPIAFNAVVRNLTGSGLEQLALALGAGGFDLVGTVTRQFSGDADVGTNGRLSVIRFDTPEFLDFNIGDPLANGSGTDWLLATAGLRAGDVLSIRFTVPEPGSMALMLAAMTALAWSRRRQRK
jgi:hypothetical protein